MIPVLLRTLFVTSLVCLISGCFGPQTPEEAAADFWDAVIANDGDAVVDSSTLTDPSDFDGFDRNWNGYQPEWGKIVIDGRKARIDTTFNHGDGDDREVSTYLVQRDEQWLVDYQRTARSARGGLFGNLFNKVSDLSEELGDRFNQSAEDANRKMDQLLDELEANQEAFSQQAEQALEAYSEQLQQSLQAMDQSIQQTLNEQGARLSEAEKQTLEDASRELGQRLEAMDPDSFASALEDSKALAQIRESLQELNTETLEEQKKQWQALSESLTEDMEKLRKEMLE